MAFQVTLRSGHLIWIIVILYLLLMWMAFQQVEHRMLHNQKIGNIFKPKIHKNFSIQLFVKECPIYHRNIHSHLMTHVKPYVKMINVETCPLFYEYSSPDIQIEEEWDQINVRYPQYIYTVSGWIQVLDVPNYTPKPLHVIIVPYSHQDPGWKDGNVGYYSSYTKRTLNNIVDKLTENPKLKFIWSEVVFLHKWYYEPDSKREDFLRLIKNGQLEIVTGGWVMTDEAVAHYTSMLNQLIEGHLWLKETLGIIPNTSWSVDPFGHSPSMTYMLKKAGINQMVIQRTHFGVKRHFAKRQLLEFFWRQAWDAGGGTDVLCHMMPFLLYSVSYSCGPDPHICCQFDFHSPKCFRGTNSQSAEPVTDKNLRKLSWALWEQYQKKAQLYQTNVLLVPHGDNFRYSSFNEWDKQFGNLDKLMKYMNTNEDMNIKIEYGTVSDYFKAFEQSRRELGVNPPTLSGDFLPYNDRDDQYWTGFYSARPLLKHMVRILQGKLRITEILFTLRLCSPTDKHPKDKSFHSDHSLALEEGRHAVSLFQHHDAITGTSKHAVMEDYSQILKNALDRVENLLLLLIGSNALQTPNTANELKPNFLIMTQPGPFEGNHMHLKSNSVGGKWLIVITNPLTISWKSVITVRSPKPGIIKTMDKDLVRSQINPVWDGDFKVIPGIFAVVFEADLEPLSTKTFLFLESYSHLHYAQVTIYGQELKPEKFDYQFNVKRSDAEMFDIENNLLRASFSSCTGTLQFTQRKTDDRLHQTSVRLVTYGTGSQGGPFRDKSGAYIFMPDGHAKELEIFNPTMLQLEGPVMSSVTTRLSDVLITATVYNISGPMGTGVHLDNLVNINRKEENNQEIALRIVSDVISPDKSICVDLNGFQSLVKHHSLTWHLGSAARRSHDISRHRLLSTNSFYFILFRQMHKKKFRSKLLIQGNFHPVTSAAFIEDGQTERLTLLTSETHGVASLKGGWLEVILDSHKTQDEWQGLDGGPRDNTYSQSHFVLIAEKREQPGLTKGPSCHLSLLAHLLSDHLNNPPVVAVSGETAASLPETNFLSSAKLLKAPFPCLYRLVNLRYLQDSRKEDEESSLTALMVLHRVSVDCNYSEAFYDCQMDEHLDLDSFKNAKIRQAMETSLTGVEDIENLKEFTVKLNNMEMKSIRVSFHH